MEEQVATMHENLLAICESLGHPQGPGAGTVHQKLDAIFNSIDGFILALNQGILRARALAAHMKTARETNRLASPADELSILRNACGNLPPHSVFFGKPRSLTLFQLPL